MDAGVRPRALVDELLQGLGVRARNSVRHRLNRLALAVEQQSREILFAPVATLGASEQIAELLDEVAQLLLKSFELRQLHLDGCPHRGSIIQAVCYLT